MASGDPPLALPGGIGQARGLYDGRHEQPSPVGDEAVRERERRLGRRTERLDAHGVDGRRLWADGQTLVDISGFGDHAAERYVADHRHEHEHEREADVHACLMQPEHCVHERQLPARSASSGS